MTATLISSGYSQMAGDRVARRSPCQRHKEKVNNNNEKAVMMMTTTMKKKKEKKKKTNHLADIILI
jgi:hypothetical protein